MRVNVDVSVMAQVLASATVTTDRPDRVVARTIADALGAMPAGMYDPTNHSQEIRVRWHVSKDA